MVSGLSPSGRAGATFLAALQWLTLPEAIQQANNLVERGAALPFILDIGISFNGGWRRRCA